MILEKQTAAFIKLLEAQGGKPLYKLTPDAAREVLLNLQSGPIEKPNVDFKQHTIAGGITLYAYRPVNSVERLPPILYFHGGGWVLGDRHTHDRLMRDLCVGTGAAIFFLDYSRSPEAKYPRAIEEGYAAARYIATMGESLNVDGSLLSFAGESVGGNLATAVALYMKKRKGPNLLSLLIFYPVTSSKMDTESYRKYAKGPWLTKAAMKWFWNAYEPTVSKRKNYLLSPLNAKPAQLKGLPPTLIITAENDVLRDEGEQFADKLMEAGVSVTAMRCLGTIHDFLLLNALAQTPPVRGALLLATNFFKKQIHKDIKIVRIKKRAA